MEKTLLETYSKRLAVSESIYTKTTGTALDNNRKMAIAMVLDNTNKFLTEAFTNSVGTQRADLGEFKKFCLNLTTVALPNLIAHDLVIVSPMSSYSGYITYVQYTSGSNKGETKRGDVFNDPFRLGKVDTNFTSSAVVEEHEITASEATDHYVEVRAMWTPVVDVKKVVVGTAEFEIIKTGTPTATQVLVEISPTDALSIGFTFAAGAIASGAKMKFAYRYNNEVIPQNDLPVVNAEIKSLPLVAKARRVAVYYSQIAAFQAKQDYGFDLGDQLAEKACGQLAYEIDTEITDLLIANAVAGAGLTFNKTCPTGVSKAEHYEGFSEIVEIAKSIIYGKTKRFAPNYMLIASDVLPILTFIKGFKAASISHINGPYLAGTLNGLKVFVTPNIASGKFVLGVNGDDFMSSAAVYAPYMAVVPTQLLGYADGGMSQGWSTLYALEMLNKDLLIAGEVVAQPQIVETHANA